MAGSNQEKPTAIEIATHWSKTFQDQYPSSQNNFCRSTGLTHVTKRKCALVVKHRSYCYLADIKMEIRFEYLGPCNKILLPSLHWPEKEKFASFDLKFLFYLSCASFHVAASMSHDNRLMVCKVGE